MPTPLLHSLREILAQLLRSPRASRHFPHVAFGHNVAVGPECRFGQRVRIYENTRLSYTEIGDYSYIGGASLLQHASLGKFCSVGSHVEIGLGLHPVDHVSTYPGFYSARPPTSYRFVSQTSVIEFQPVKIGHDVWIGNGVRILDGVQIGHGAIVGTGAIVTRDVAPYTIVAGVPARPLRTRFDHEMIAFLLDIAWWDRGEAFLQQYAPLFATPEQFRAALTSS